MALSKSFPDLTDVGSTVAAPYTKISSINIDLFGKSITFTVLTWRSQAAMNADKQPMRSNSYTLYPQAGPDGLPGFDTVIAANPGAFAALRNYIYTILKSHPDFTGATDV